MRFHQSALIALLIAVGSPALSLAAGFGANDADSGISYADYRRCYVLDIWRLSQVPPDSPAARAITTEGRNLGGAAVRSGAARGRSTESVVSELRTYTATQTALYNGELANPPATGLTHAQDDEAYCQRRGLISRTPSPASSPAP